MARFTILVLLLSAILLVQADNNKHNKHNKHGKHGKHKKESTTLDWWHSMWQPGSAIATYTDTPPRTLPPPESSEVWWREIRSEWVATMTTVPEWAERVWEEELTMPTTTATKLITTIVPESLASARRANMTTSTAWWQGK